MCYKNVIRWLFTIVWRKKKPNCTGYLDDKFVLIIADFFFPRGNCPRGGGGCSGVIFFRGDCHFIVFHHSKSYQQSINSYNAAIQILPDLRKILCCETKASYHNWNVGIAHQRHSTRWKIHVTTYLNHKWEELPCLVAILQSLLHSVMVYHMTGQQRTGQPPSQKYNISWSYLRMTSSRTRRLRRLSRINYSAV